MNVDTAVAAGAAWLDHRIPNWVNDLDLERLDIENASNCVLGQLGNGYWMALRSFGLQHAEASRLGFSSELFKSYDLEAEWKRVVEERRAGPASDPVRLELTTELVERIVELRSQIDDPNNMLESAEIRLGGVIFRIS